PANRSLSFYFNGSIRVRDFCFGSRVDDRVTVRHSRPRKGGSHEKVKTYPPTAIRTDTHAGRLAELAHSADSSPGTGSTGSKSGKGRGTDRPAGFKGRD